MSRSGIAVLDENFHGPDTSGAFGTILDPQLHACGPPAIGNYNGTLYTVDTTGTNPNSSREQLIV